MTTYASIDLGSHTARLLVSRKTGDPGLIRPLVRKRAYIRLAEGFDDQRKGTIKRAAIDRTLNALEEFASIARRFDVDTIHAVSTGVMRKAVNRDRLLNLIYDRTGVKVEVISGEEEARLTGKGVLHALNIEDGPFVIFDFGGGSTEFLFGKKADMRAKSIPLGAMILTQRYLPSDPPEEMDIETLVKYVDGVLEETFPRQTRPVNDGLLAGTGGTVTTLAAMIHRIEMEDMGPERMNGLILKRERIEDLFARMKTLPLIERLKLPGLDRGRVDVILAGSLVVMRILHFFKASEMLVSLSDLLEGILIDRLSGSAFNPRGQSPCAASRVQG